jgi:hypothetical protein
METKLVNGWNREEIDLLCERTGCKVETVLRFCQAVDKYLYLMLSTEGKRATLHFHLKEKQVTESQTESQDLEEPKAKTTKKRSIKSTKVVKSKL